MLHRTKFETELQVRPDDIDLFRHVHSSRYLDYLLAARFDQMERCYGMSMEEFLKMGLGWFVRTSHFEYKRALGIAERFVVRTWVEDVRSPDVEVRFEMLKGETRRPACVGWCVFTLVKLETGKSESIPDWIIEKYSVWLIQAKQYDSTKAVIWWMNGRVQSPEADDSHTTLHRVRLCYPKSFMAQ